MIFRLRLGGQVGAFAMNQCVDVQSGGRQDGGQNNGCLLERLRRGGGRRRNEADNCAGD